MHQTTKRFLLQRNFYPSHVSSFFSPFSQILITLPGLSRCIRHHALHAHLCCFWHLTQFGLSHSTHNIFVWHRRWTDSLNKWQSRRIDSSKSIIYELNILFWMLLLCLLIAWLFAGHPSSLSALWASQVGESLRHMVPKQSLPKISLKTSRQKMSLNDKSAS